MGNAENDAARTAGEATAADEMNGRIGLRGPKVGLVGGTPIA